VPDESRCRSAFRNIDDLTTLWAEWYQGEPAAQSPGLSAFERACMMLDEEAQLCLVPAYGKTHKDACLGLFEAAPKMRDKLSKILLSP
jgi:hypothetical protein